MTYSLCIRAGRQEKKASDTLRNSHDAEVTQVPITWAKKKTYTFLHGISGTIRVKWDLKTDFLNRPAHSKIKKNNGTVDLTADITEVATDYVTKSQDITMALVGGETIELWLAGNDGTYPANALARNFRLYYDDEVDTSPTTS